MNFVQPVFAVFLVVVWATYWLLRGRVAQNALLLFASAVFYGWVHPWFLTLLFASACLDYFVALGIRRWRHRTRALVAVSVAGNLSLLGVFKYLDFFVQNVVDALTALGVHTDLTTLGVFLPVGISFYTFQTMSYTLDVARRQVEPREDFLDYALYVTFFPQLVAGPIERATTLLPQVERSRAWSWADQREGIGLFVWGAFKKLAIADAIAPYVDLVFQVDGPRGPMVWIAAMAFAVQILADFSGYTDMARGCARLLGFRLVPNFDHPYLSASTPEFWRRWHMSLSDWILQYLWLPLMGGAPTSSWGRFAFATVVAFGLMGLWHGASWNFLGFGLWSAAWVLIYAAITPLVPASLARNPAARAAAVAFHWCVPLTTSMLIFREHHGDRLWAALTSPPWIGTADQWTVTVAIAAVTLVLAAPLVLALVIEQTVLDRVRRWEWGLPVETATWAVLAVAALVMYRSGEDFVYFAF